MNKANALRKPVLDNKLYLITDNLQQGDSGEEGKLLCKLEAALAGGAKAIQLREKHLTAGELLLLAKKLRALTRDYGASLFINERVDIALATDADGVHLRASSFAPLEARKLLGPDKLIGVSTHSLEQAKKAAEQGANFITLGPVFHTPSKARYGEPLGLENLKDISGSINIPTFALGGVTKDNIKEVLNAGASGAAMIKAIMAATEIAKTTQEIISKLNTISI